MSAKQHPFVDVEVHVTDKYGPTVHEFSVRLEEITLRNGDTTWNAWIIGDCIDSKHLVSIERDQDPETFVHKHLQRWVKELVVDNEA